MGSTTDSQRARSRTRRLGRAVAVACLSLGLAAGIAASDEPASGPSVVQVRVGRHPTFTRVVFELDAPAGYRIERPVDDPKSVVVTLDASSPPRRVVSASIALDSVSVEPARERSQARLALRAESPKIREMMLADPPRIVLDVLLDEAQIAAAGGRPRAAVASRQTEAIEAPPPDEPARIAAREPATPESAPEPPPVAETTPSEPLPEPQQLARAEAEPVAPPAPDASAESAPPPPAPEPGPSERAEADEPPPAEPPRAAARPEPAQLRPLPPPTASPLAEREAAPTRPAPARPEPRRSARREPPPPAASASEGLFGLGLSPIVLAAAGVLALIVIVVALARWRTRRGTLDVTTLAGDDAEDGEPAGAESEFDFGERPAGATSSAATTPVPETSEPTRSDEPRLDEVDVRDEPGLFDEPPKREGTMDRDMDLPISSHDEPISAPPPVASVASVAGDGGDVARLVQELQRRIEQLEARLDQSNEARERIERQVASQSEELRVQRAAIARTQRALRSMNRSEEDQVTEPALREPAR